MQITNMSFLVKLHPVSRHDTRQTVILVVLSLSRMYLENEKRLKLSFAF